MTPQSKPVRSFAIALCAILLPNLLSCAQQRRQIVVWKVGSPHTGDIPPATIPADLLARAARLGFTVRIQSFPASGFASTFRQAVKSNAPPELLAFDNFGILTGITTSLGQFDGIAQGPDSATDLIQVTGTFDSLLARGGGWVYADRKSRNYSAAAKLALTPPECLPGDAWPETQKALGEVVTNVAAAYLEWDADRIRSLADRDRLETPPPATRAAPSPNSPRKEPAKVGTVKLCGLRGNDKLAIAWTNTSLESQSGLGHTPVLLILRNAASGWKLLVASRDPVTNRNFVNNLRARPMLFTAGARDDTPPAPAVLLSPAPMVYPAAPTGERFGSFAWQPSRSHDVANQIVEFAYDNDARMFLADPIGTVPVQRISDGSLWHTDSIWRWRVWSVSAEGDVAFSESRPLPH